MNGICVDELVVIYIHFLIMYYSPTSASGLESENSDDLPQSSREGTDHPFFCFIESIYNIIQFSMLILPPAVMISCKKNHCQCTSTAPIGSFIVFTS